MRASAFVLLALAVLVTAGLVPMTYQIAAHNGRDGQPAGFGILALCLLRALLFVAAFLLLTWDGRLDRWAASRVLQSLLVAGGVGALEISVCALHFLSIDYQVSAPFPIIFGILATLLPLAVVAAGFLVSRTWFVSAAAVAMAAALLAYASYRPLTAEWRRARMPSAPASDK